MAEAFFQIGLAVVSIAVEVAVASSKTSNRGTHTASGITGRNTYCSHCNETCCCCDSHSVSSPSSSAPTVKTTQHAAPPPAQRGSAKPGQQKSVKVFVAPTSTEEKPEKEGYLVKQGHFIRNWRNRFFKLSNGKFMYYANRNQRDVPLGEIQLKGCEVEVVSKEWHDKPLLYIQDKIQNKKFFMYGETYQETMSWRNALAAAINQANTSTPSTTASSSPTTPNKTNSNANNNNNDASDVKVPYIQHIITSTDTLVGLSLKYNTTVEQIKQVNHLTSDQIHALPHLWIPTTLPSESPVPLPTAPPQSELIDEFQLLAVDDAVSGDSIEKPEAEFYLRNSNWDLQQAAEERRRDLQWERNLSVSQEIPLNDDKPTPTPSAPPATPDVD